MSGEAVENPQFAAARSAGKTCFEIAELGGCVVCWGKGRWLGITDTDWHKLAWNAPRTEMRCGFCRGSGLAPRVTQPTSTGPNQ